MWSGACRIGNTEGWPIEASSSVQSMVRLKVDLRGGPMRGRSVNELMSSPG